MKGAVLFLFCVHEGASESWTLNRNYTNVTNLKQNDHNTKK